MVALPPPSWITLVPGVRVRYEPRRVALGKLPYLVAIDFKIAGVRKGTVRSFATAEDAWAQYPAAAAEVAAIRAELAVKQRLTKALNVPPLPAAPKGVILFETFARKWLAVHVKTMCTPATYKNYERLLNNHVLKIMRTWPMTGEVMNGERLQDVFKVDLAKKGVPLPTRLACYACVRALFRWGKNRLPPSAAFNPHVLEDIGMYIRNPNEKHIRLQAQANPMTRVQVEAFLSYQQTHYPELYEWYVWLVDEGSRVGEVAALKWEHLDLDRGKAHIREAFSWAQLEVDREDGDDKSVGEKDTKTHRTDQYIDLSDRVRTVFPKLRARHREAWLAYGRQGPEPRHCFLTDRLGPRRPDNTVYRSFREACDVLQLKGQTGQPFTIHCLRDTFATLAILSGKRLGWVSMMLGHASSKTTEKHYIKWVRLVEDNPLAGEQGGVGQGSGQ